MATLKSNLNRQQSDEAEKGHPLLSRSEVMARVRSKNTGPEVAVRRAMHASGLRFRLHAKKLRGVPDIVFPGRKVAVFVHGCFWHQHPACTRARMPVDNLAYWSKKLQGNVDRDAVVKKALEAAGWTILIVWECEIRKAGFLDGLADRIKGLPLVRKSGRGSPKIN